MSSHSPTPVETSAEVKTEESAVSAANATSNAPSAATGITKQELEVMDGIVHRMSDHRTEEYVLGSSSCIPFLPQKLTLTVAMTYQVYSSVC